MLLSWLRNRNERLTPDNIDLFARYSENDIVAPALIGFETLRALKQACDECGLTRAE